MKIEQVLDWFLVIIMFSLATVGLLVLVLLSLGYKLIGVS